MAGELPPPRFTERLRYSQVLGGWVSGAAQFGSISEVPVVDYYRPFTPGPTRKEAT